jgi:DNA-binding response OmpR family regulator
VAAALELDIAPVEAGPLALWPSDGQCIVDGRRVQLSRREFEVLLVLVSSAGHLVRRTRLHELCWQQPLAAGNRDVDAYVFKLRRKLRAVAPDWSFIHTHSKIGYRLWPEREDER